MKIHPIDNTDQIPEWIDQEPPARMLYPPARVFEVNDPGYDERAARFGRLERRRVFIVDETNINIARFRI